MIQQQKDYYKKRILIWKIVRIIIYTVISLAGSYLVYEFTKKPIRSFWVFCAIFVVLDKYFQASLGIFVPKTRSVTNSIIINAPIETVWNVIRDYEHRGEWYNGIIKTEKLSDWPEVWKLTVHQKIMKNAKPFDTITKIVVEKEPEHLITESTVKSELLDFSSVSDTKLKKVNENTTELTGIHTVTDKKFTGRFYMAVIGGSKYALQVTHDKYRLRAEELNKAV